MAVLTFGGGLNEQDETSVQPEECVEGYNFEIGLGNTHFKPRKPFDLLGTASNGSALNGFVQLITTGDIETTLAQAGDTVYLWDGSTGFTSKGSCDASSKLRGTTWSLGNYSIITDISKATVVKTWDGSTYATMTTGLGVNFYAKYAIVHRGRAWFFNCKATTDTPHLIAVSQFEVPTNLDVSTRVGDAGFSTGEEPFYMLTPDLKPINGVALFYDELVISTENGRLWKLTGTDNSDFAWTDFYAGSSALGPESMSNIGNDVLYMKKDGVIETLRATQDFGDVAADDLSKWIRTTTSSISAAITVYDQARQKVYLFCGSNKVLVLFKDMLVTKLSPWTAYRTNHASSFDATSAIYMRQPGGSKYYVYWGDSSGRVYQMEGTGDGDPSTTAIDTYRKTMLFEDLQNEKGKPIDPRIDKIRGRVHYRRVADCDLLMDFQWADDYATNRCTVPLDGPASGSDSNYFGGSAYFGGTFYFNAGFQLAERISTKGFSPVGRGPGFSLSLTVQDTQSFDVLSIKI